VEGAAARYQANPSLAHVAKTVFGELEKVMVGLASQAGSGGLCLDLEAQVLESAHQAFGSVGPVEAVEVVGAEVAVVDVIAQHVVGGRQGDPSAKSVATGALQRYTVPMPRRRSSSAARRKPRNVVGSWIWVVLTPQIEHCRYELAILEKSLTFRSHSRRFERLLPLREALTADGAQVFDDFVGEIPKYDAATAAHDGALLALLDRAEKVYSALVADPKFAQVFDQIAGEVRKINERAVPTAEDKASWLRWVAGDVVNDLAPDLTSQSSDWLIWNQGASLFKAIAHRTLLADLASKRSHFKDVVQKTSEDLSTIRKRLSRQYDIPVVPISGAGVEGPLG